MGAWDDGRGQLQNPTFAAVKLEPCCGVFISRLLPTLPLLLATLAILLKFRKVPEPVIIAGAS